MARPRPSLPFLCLGLLEEPPLELLVSAAQERLGIHRRLARRTATAEQQAQQALDSYRVAAMASDEEGDARTFVLATSGAALTLALADRPEEAVTWLQQAESKATSQDAEGWCRKEVAAGALLIAEGLAAQGVERLNEAYAWSIAGRQWASAMQAASLAASRTQGAVKRHHGEQVLKAAEASGNKRWIAAAHAGLGWIHDANGDFVAGVDSFRRALDLVGRGDRLERMRATWALGRELRVAGKVAEAILVIRPAREEAMNGISAIRTPEDQEWLGRLAFEDGLLCQLEGNFVQALRHLRFAQQNFAESGADSLAPELLREVAVAIAEVRLSLDQAGKKP